jgi:hypothetical protein
MAGGWGWLVGVGFLFGMLHVVTGPDHLSAIATLSAGVNKREAFVLGVRWGLGHSSGLLLVASVFLALGSSVVDLDKIGHIGDLVIAGVLILLGTYGVHLAVKKYRKARSAGVPLTANPDNDVPDVVVTADDNYVDLEDHTARQAQVTTAKRFEAAPGWGAPPLSPHNSKVTQTNTKLASPTPLQAALPDTADEISESQLGLKQSAPHKRCGMVVGGPGMQKLLSFCVGVLHGVAGPGGVLAVLPAIQLNNWRKALFYLMFFAISSTLTMGVAAGLYGAVTSLISPTIKRRSVPI